MAILLHQCAAALYLLAGITAWLGMAWRAPRFERAAVGVLLAGALVHVAAFGARLYTRPTRGPRKEASDAP